METKKSVSDFQFEYGEFQLQYGEFSGKTGRETAGIWPENTEKAGLPDGKPRSAVTKIQLFQTKSKKC